jgi:signal transduction histidine kinase/DNA-binding response OmpR family regulator
MTAGSRINDSVDEKVNILLVDDRPDKLLALGTMLEPLKQNVVTATSGTDALRCLLQQDFAVVLLDVNMPIMDGFETATMIRQRPRSETTPIIFVSAVNDTEKHLSRGYSLGAVDYIVTPIAPEILRAKVAVFVDLYKKTELIKRQGEQRADFVREQAARAAAEDEQRRLAFLAEASNVLSGSLENREILENLAELVVPKLADYCVVHMLDEGHTLWQVAVAHADKALEQQARAAGAECPIDCSSSEGVARIVESGKSEIFSATSDGLLRSCSCDDAQFELLKAMRLTAAMVVPLNGRGRTLGTMSLFTSGARRQYGAAELSLAEAFAERAALALENAALYATAQRARVEAESANQAKDQFLAMLSHELRTPLTPVLSTILSLEHEHDLPENLRTALAMIRRNVELEARLIDDLLDLTRISKGKVQLNLELVDAHQLLRNALEICGPDIAGKQLEVDVSLQAVEPRLEGDPARLQQIFWNLIKNAVKFTSTEGRVSVATENLPNGTLEISVADSGIGIDPEALPRIFDAFEQGDHGRFGGVGLGLAISKTLAELHCGTISAESNGVGLGAKFTLRLPAYVANGATATPTEDTTSTVAERHSARILLVEDHEDTNRSLTRLLRRRGYEVLSASNVESALELGRSKAFDVLVSDMSLPDGSGLDVMRTLANGNGGMFAIAVSGYGMEADIRKSHDAGFTHHLIKPVDLNKLDALIQEHAIIGMAAEALN